MNVAAHSDRRIHLKEVRLGLEDLSASCENEESLFFGETTFTVEVLLEKRKVGLCWVIRVVELIIAGFVESRCLDI